MSEQNPANPNPNPNPAPETPPPGGNPEPPKPSEFKPIQSQDEFDRVIADRIKRAADKARDEAKQEYEAEQKRIKDEEAAERKRQADLEAGKFEEVRAEIEKDRDSFKDRAESAERKLDQALTLLASSVNERWTDVPEEVAELYEGDADDPLAKTAFIEKNAKLIARIKGTQDATEEKYRRASNTKTPNPDPTGKPETDEKVAQAFSRRIQ